MAIFKYTQDNIDYFIDDADNLLKRILGTSPFQKPTWNGSQIVEGWTQQDQDAKDEAQAEQLALDIVQNRINDGEDFFNKVATKVKRAYDNGNITQAQFKNIRTSLKDVLLPLKLGDWDLAQDNINTVTRPSGQLGALYDFIKNKIDQYVLDNY